MSSERKSIRYVAGGRHSQAWRRGELGVPGGEISPAVLLGLGNVEDLILPARRPGDEFAAPTLEVNSLSERTMYGSGTTELMAKKVARETSPKAMYERDTGGDIVAVDRLSRLEGRLADGGGSVGV